MESIYAGVFGSGLGHITRTYTIATTLQAQYNTRFFYSTFEEALDFLRRRGEPVVESPSVEMHWNPSGGFSSKGTMTRLPVHVRDFSSQVAFETEQISKLDPKLVISDSRLSTLLAAKAIRIPSITIVNQFKILLPPRARQSRLSTLYERIGGDTLGFLWSLGNYVLFPDLPPPFTIGEANVAGTDLSSKVRFTGFMSPRLETVGDESFRLIRRILDLDSRPLIFVQISGPEPTRAPLIEVALKSAQFLSREYNLVISKGMATGTIEPTRLGCGAWVYEWCPIKDELFLVSDLIIARSGHTTISQCIESGKPAVLVPIYNHSEQISNADKFAKLGMGIEIRSEDLTPQKLVFAVKKCMEDSRYRENSLNLKRISDKYDGIHTAVEFVKEFL